MEESPVSTGAGAPVQVRLNDGRTVLGWVFASRPGRCYVFWVDSLGCPAHGWVDASRVSERRRTA